MTQFAKIMMSSCAPVWLQTILARPGDKAHYDPTVLYCLFMLCC